MRMATPGAVYVLTLCGLSLYGIGCGPAGPPGPQGLPDHKVRPARRSARNGCRLGERRCVPARER
jgi:hypothetical protein